MSVSDRAAIQHGGMVSRPEDTSLILSKKLDFLLREFLKLLRANARSAVRVFTGEAGEVRQPPDALLAVFALKPAALFLTNREETE